MFRSISCLRPFWGALFRFLQPLDHAIQGKLGNGICIAGAALPSLIYITLVNYLSRYPRGARDDKRDVMRTQSCAVPACRWFEPEA